MSLTSKYWNVYYKKKKKNPRRSNFANFINKNYLRTSNKNFLEVGCGDGRDTFYFAKKILNVFAFDISKEAISLNIKNHKTKKFNIKFYPLSISKAYNMNFPVKFNYIYMRFLLHAINEKNENLLFKFFKKNLTTNGLIFFEFRTTNDPLYLKGKKLSKYERYTDHYRRFIDLKILKNKIKKLRLYKIIYMQEKSGFSKTKKDNPTLCRLIIQKKI